MSKKHEKQDRKKTFVGAAIMIAGNSWEEKACA